MTTTTPSTNSTTSVTCKPSAASAASAASLRQQVLVLYLNNSALDSEVIGWSLYDGTGRATPTTGDTDEPPYETGVAALIDGWRLFQAAQLIPPFPGQEYEVSFLKHEFLFEKLVDTADVTASR